MAVTSLHHSCSAKIGYGWLAPRRYTVSPPIPHRIRKPPPPPSLARATQLTPNINMFAISSPEVTGASCSPKSPESFLLSAPRENRRLSRHSCQLVVLIPTSAPHAGQIFGRGCCSPPPKNPRILFFHFSTRHCQR